MQNVHSYLSPQSPTGPAIPDNPLPTTIEPAITEVETGSKIIPVFRSLSALRAISLTASGFAAGWQIGSLLNEKWFHIAGVGLGTTASVPSATTALTWRYGTPGGYPTSGANVSPFKADQNNSSVTVGKEPSGWYLYGTNTGCSISNAPLQIFTSGAGALGTPNCWESASSAAFSALGSSAQLIDEGAIQGTSSANVNRASLIYIPEASISTALVTDQPIQPYTGQASTITTAWPTPGGQGDTSDATTTLPTSGDPSFCVLQGSSTRCINATTSVSGFPAPDSTTNNGVQSIAGLPADSNYTDPGQNLIRCLNAPSLFTCPTVSGGVVTNVGGAKFIFPNVSSLSESDAESQINSWFAGAGFSPPAYTIVTLNTAGAVITQPAGSVVSTSPAGGATVLTAPATVTITENPDPLPQVVLSPLPWETGTDYASRMSALGIKVSLIPTGTPVFGYGPDEVISPTDVPGGSTTWTVVPGQRISGNSTLTVPINIDTATTPEGDPNPAPGGSGSGCNCPPLDFSPLTSLGLGSKFPFGVFAYATSIISDFNVTPHAPDFNLRAQATGVDGHNLDAPYDVNLGDISANHVGNSLNTYMGWWRDLLSFAMWIGAIWWVGTKLFGFDGTGDPGEAIDDA